VLGEARYLAAAERAADFLLSNLYDGATLLRRFRDGDAAIAGFLDDYAFFAQALLDLYEASFRLKYLETAIDITERMLALFEDAGQGGFYSTAEGDPSLVMRMKEDYDGAEPSGNSIAVMNLLRLARLTGNEQYRASADRTLEAFGSRLKSAPSGVPQMLVGVIYSQATPKQVVIAGARDAPETTAMLREMHSHFAPNYTVFLVDSEETAKALARYNPVIASMSHVEGKPTAYVCENFACQLPVTSVDKFIELLEWTSYDQS
jgi:uncharacterized protein YyaL (SSP411 family)